MFGVGNKKEGVIVDNKICGLGAFANDAAKAGYTNPNGTVNLMEAMEVVKKYGKLVPKAELERTPVTDTVSLSTKNNAEKVEPQKPKAQPKEAGSGKKWGVGIASAVIPGLGQAINGEWGKAAGFFFGGIAASVVAATTAPLIGLAGLGLGIWSIVDAVKSAKAE